MNPSLARRLSALALGLFPVLSSLLQPARATFVGAHHASLRRSPRVPYPESVQLLDRLIGGTHPYPPVMGTHHPESYHGRPLFDPRESTALLELLFLATSQQQEVFERLFWLTLEAGGYSVRKKRPIAPDEEPFLEAIDALAQATVFQGLHPLLGQGCDVFLISWTPGLAPFRLEFRPMNVVSLGLIRVDLSTPARARDTLESFPFVFRAFLETRLRLEEAEQVLQVTPGPGLVEVERTLKRMRTLAEFAADGTLSTGERRPLDKAFQADIERLERVGELTLFDALPLLEGGEVWLGSADVGYVHFDLPELPDLSTADVTAVSTAERALASLDGALSYVQEERERVAVLVPLLLQQVVHVEPR